MRWDRSRAQGEVLILGTRIKLWGVVNDEKVHVLLGLASSLGGLFRELSFWGFLQVQGYRGIKRLLVKSTVTWRFHSFSGSIILGSRHILEWDS